MKTQKGFTLIELMIVVAIIGILAAVAMPQFQIFTKKARASEAPVMLDNLITAEALYFTEHNHMTDLVSELGVPSATAQYFNFFLTGTTTKTTATATPNATALSIGLTSSWSMTYNGVTDKKTTSFPGSGF